MKKISILFIFAVFQAALASAQSGPALSQLDAAAPLNISATVPGVPVTSVVYTVKNTPGYILRTGRHLPAVGKGNGSAGDPWSDLIQKAVTHGTHDTAYFDIWYLADIVGPANGPHTAYYFTVEGRTDPDGTFFPKDVQMSSEYWTITPDGNWRIEEWPYQIGLDGVVQLATHTVLLERRDGIVLDMQTELLDAGDPAVEANCNTLKEKWYHYVPAKL